MVADNDRRYTDEELRRHMRSCPDCQRWLRETDVDELIKEMVATHLHFYGEPELGIPPGRERVWAHLKKVMEEVYGKEEKEE